ncbi:taurine catabolism dioxygenase tauD, tfdA family domain-containing protein [Trichoderma breve]|uniref:Taurine catabolism dioxygenase tauD, tfdA family domain-containing protein n=1 Tax=Trichoderma breve TaxID=2034170 RepID=A0A9W9BE88_9HYPO|nr:taurine catabolism dioxygenase tauD, tfdA family domain-containing protein [Trichoderma breve]KAJ4857951.1 taurine catabolism dioxygenase tauD, tfdA family domain-containing protein [Trichoderma breve]
MAPSVTETVTEAVTQVTENLKQKPAASLKDQTEPALETGHREPLKLSGALDQFKQFEVTPVIGKEFVDVDLAEWLRAPNSDELLRDLAITVSQRGVVFFRKQDNITNDLQKELVQRLGELSGKPKTSGLHIHPVNNGARDHGVEDNEISVISSEQAKKIYADRFLKTNKRQSQKSQWHSDITFEPIPSDYALLRLTELPTTGGDTLWASGYELYDRISKPLQKFFDGLTAYYAQPGFKEAADHNGFSLFSTPRGAPENIGDVLEAIHPVIRTNPVTGWKSVFAVGHHVQHIHGLSEEESKYFLDWFVRLIVENHDLQVRNRWQNVNDLAIWDNRSVYHAATPDYLHQGLGERTGSRSVSLGEKPYFDPQSVSRREAIASGKV